MTQPTPYDEISRSHGGAQQIRQSERETEIERLAAEIDRLIQASEPETREELAQSANSLIREQGLGPGGTVVGEQGRADPRRGPFNPLAAGIGLLIIGAAMSLLLPFVGLTLAALGVVAALWGVTISAMRK